MTCREQRAAKAREALKAVNVPRVDELTESELCRIYGQMRRYEWARKAVPMVVLTGPQKARSRVTHPGKRSR